MLPAQVRVPGSEEEQPGDLPSAKIQFARIGNIDVDIFADTAGLAALGSRLPDTVYEGDRIVLDLDIDLLGFPEDDRRDLKKIRAVRNEAEMRRIESIKEFKGLFRPPDIFHGALFYRADIRLRCGDDICNLLLRQSLLAVPEHLHLAIGEQPILHAILFYIQT
jgi:hypothetical protein